MPNHAVALMQDRSIRELEQALILAPGDSVARVALVRALARAGRRSDTLARLDLALVPGRGALSSPRDDLASPVVVTEIAVFLDARPEAISFYEGSGYEPHTAPLYRKRLALPSSQRVQP